MKQPLHGRRMVSLALKDVGLTFQSRATRYSSLKQFVIHRLCGRKHEPVADRPSLEGINLHLKQGDRVGIIGNNGAGKSTLLRVMSGVYPPTVGEVTIQGKVSSLFDVTMGFDLHSSGWDNIDLRGFLQGETPKSMRLKRERIVQFSGLDEAALNKPMKCFSTGMIVRLGFSIATEIDPEILIVDEILSAGDLEFQERARARMNKMMDSARIVVLASHDLHSLEEFCEHVAWLEQGRIREFDRTSAVLRAYTQSCRVAA